jgi:Bacterial regulatory helix-turn-helix protein, lysR family
MENFRLKMFRTVATYLNFSRAAEELLTQPAVTQQIKALEPINTTSTPCGLRENPHCVMASRKSLSFFIRPASSLVGHNQGDTATAFMGTDSASGDSHTGTFP